MTDSMLERVRKLLAKAEDPACTPEEAAALNDKAAELIAKYGVDRALLAASMPESDPVGDRVVPVLAPYALDKTALLATVARAMRCRTVRRKVFGPGGLRRDYSFADAMSLVEYQVQYERQLLLNGYSLLPHSDRRGGYDRRRRPRTSEDRRRA